MKLTTILGALVLGTLLAPSAIETNAKDDAGLKAHARITQADAEKTALAKVPGGKVKKAELEEEDGKLVWSIDITTPGSKDVTEVLVDAKTGAVMSVEKESPEAEAREKAEERGEPEKDDDQGQLGPRLMPGSPLAPGRASHARTNQ